MPKPILFAEFHEERVVRPYAEVGAVQDVMDDLSLVYGDEDPIQPGATRTIETATYVNATPEVRWLRPPHHEESRPEHEIWDSFHRRLRATVKKTGVDPEAVQVMVIASTSYLKLAETVWSGTLSEFRSASRDGDQVGLPLECEPRPGPFQTPRGGCTVAVYVVLAKQLRRAARKPWRKGTWLARALFTIETDLGEIGFTPRPMDDAVRVELGLPPGTIRYVDIPSPLDPSEGAVEIAYYVDIDLLDEIVANPRANASVTFLHQIALDVTRTVVTTSSKEIAKQRIGSLSEIEDSLCARLIVAAARTERGDRDHVREQTLFNLVKNEPDRYLAHEEARITKLKPALLKSLRSD